MAEAQELNTDQKKLAEAQGVEDLTQQFEELDVSDLPVHVPIQDDDEENRKIHETAEKKPTIIDTMWNTVLDHRYGYANGPVKTTHLVCKIDGKTIKEKNTDGTHAEINFIKYLETHSVAGKHLTVYINNSPCHVCANALKDYLKKNKDFKFTIYVTHLYNIRRKSCVDRKENHISHIHSHEATYNELKKLLSLGKERCTIKAFTKEVWKELHEVMSLTKDSQHMKLKTYSTRNTEEKHDRSREREDKYIKSDLEHLQANDDP